jgi:hypothetical protein
MKCSTARSGWLVGAALAAALAANAGPRDPLYQWTDANGAVRYTSEIERIPADQRSAAVSIAAGRSGAPATEPVPAPDATGPITPGVAPVDSAPPASAAPDDPRMIRLDARIAQLERLIAADEAALGDYISDPERTLQSKQGDTGDVAAIADRLPRMQNELRELRKQREAAAPAAPNAAAP